jgi:predicted alpha/beta hydrolase
VAASTGFWRWETAPFRYLAWYFWRVHGPVSLALKGYVPSGAGWSGLPLPRGVFSEWRDWCLRREHFAPDVVAGRVPNYFDSLTAPLLSIGFTDDPIATRRTVAALLAFYANAQLEQRWYGPQDIGSRRIGHEGFFASRHRDALWTPTLDWLDAQLTRLTNRTT